MSNPYRKLTVRFRIDIDRPDLSPVVLGQGSTPQFWDDSGVRFEIAFFENNQICTSDRLANLTTVRFRVFDQSRTGSAYMDQTITGAAIHTNVSLADWTAANDAHAAFDFRSPDTALNIPAGAKQQEYFFLVQATTSDDPTNLNDMGGGKIDVIRSADDPTESIIGSNRIPTSAVYDGSGNYVLNLVSSATYVWTKGANDTSVTNGTETVTVSGSSFITQGTSITLVGTAGQPVTAVVNAAGTLTVAEMDSRYQRSGGGGSSGYKGVAAIGNNATQIVISGLALGFSPVGGYAQVMTPANGLVMQASIDPATLTSDGFTANFTGKTDSTNYKLSYTLF